MHWCSEESNALLATIPFIGIYYHRIRAFICRMFHRLCNKEHHHD